MCTPIGLGIAALVLAGTSSVVSYSAAEDAAEAQAQHNASLQSFRNAKALNEADHQRMQYAVQQEQYYEVGEQAVQNARKQYLDVSNQIDQSRSVQMAQIKRVSLDTLRASSITKAAAEETQIAGRSVDQALMEFEQAEAMNTLNNHINMKNEARQAYRQMQGIQANAQAQANQAIPQPLQPVAAPPPLPTVVGPSPVAYGLQAASQAFGMLAASGALAPVPNVPGGGWSGSAQQAMAPAGSYGATTPVYGQMPYVPTFI